MSESRGAFLFLALFVPNADPERDDPDALADDLVRTINGAGAPPYGDAVMVGGIPAPQWLTPETLANLRRAAAGEAE